MDPLYEVDIVSADVLSGALITGDRVLFEDYTYGDFYSLGMDALRLPSTENYRKFVKYLHLVIQYGGGHRNTYPLHFKSLITKKEWKDLYQKYKSYLKGRYHTFFNRCKDFSFLGGYYKKRFEHPKLPNGFGLTISKPYATPAHVIQAITKILATRLFLNLEELGYDTVFEIHDAVITRKYVSEETANEIIANIAQAMLTEIELEWPIPPDSRFAKTEKLKFEKAA